MNSTATPPLVSVIVRTVGRPAFSRALASIAAQTHRPVEIAPSHVAQLLATATVAGLPVAYSQTHLVDASGPGRVFGGPFDREALLRSNYLAIHAVLFHRSLIDAGARFDTTLATFEDWDFWLQLSGRAPFAFTGQPTAIYHAAAGASGAGAGANLDREAVLAQRERLMAKWLQR